MKRLISILSKSINIVNLWINWIIFGQERPPTLEERRVYLKQRFAKFEYSAWLSVSLTFFAYSIVDILLAFDQKQAIDAQVGYRLIFSLIGFAVIILSGNIFGMPPVSAVMFLVLDKTIQIGVSDRDLLTKIREEAKIDFLNELNPRQLLAYLIWVSDNIANQSSKRSNVYLVIGVIVAFAGLLIFYARIILAAPVVDSSDKWEYIVQYVPTGSALFFVEFVAFFFLRQSRNISDEYRHFEAVRRKREENFLILRMFNESSYVSTQEVLRNMEIYTGINAIKKDETTEIISLRRDQADELGLFVEFLRAARTRGESGKKASSKENAQEN